MINSGESVLRYEYLYDLRENIMKKLLLADFEKLALPTSYFRANVFAQTIVKEQHRYKCNNSKNKMAVLTKKT
jgi:hypothetical protein